MSNDPAPSSDILTEPPQNADYEAVYTEITAFDRGRRFPAEYAGRDGPPDSQRLIRTIARLEAVMRNGPSQLPAAITERLAAVAATIAQVDAVLAATATSGPDIHFAVERIQDIASALRRREVEAVLCDALEAAIREVGDAVVRNDAAAAGVLSAAALLRDAALRIDEMVSQLGAAGAGSEHDACAGPTEEQAMLEAPPAPHGAESLNDSAGRPACDMARGDAEAERFDDTVRESAADAASPNAADENGFGVPNVLPDKQAAAAPEENSPDSLTPMSLPIPSPLDGRNEIFSAEGRAHFAASSPPEAAAAAQPSPLHVNQSSAREPASAALNDPLGALHALSVEELVALFS
jgi:hypothetical protein